MLSVEKQNAIMGACDDEPFGRVRERREALHRILRVLASKPGGPVEEADRPELVRQRVKSLRVEGLSHGDALTVIDCDLVLVDAAHSERRASRSARPGVALAGKRRRVDRGS